MDATFITDILGTPAGLLNCEDVSAKQVSLGIELHGLDSGETLYELGLRSGDILLELNALSMETYTDAVDTLTELWVNEQEMENHILSCLGECVLLGVERT